jgi:hypothetical protein
MTPTTRETTMGDRYLTLILGWVTILLYTALYLQQGG